MITIRAFPWRPPGSHDGPAKDKRALAIFVVERLQK
jgi:hypothetical protein